MRIALYVCSVLVIATVAVVISRTPQLDRIWDPDVRVLAEVVIADDRSQFTLSNVRNWRYADDGPISREYFNETYRFADLTGMFLYEQILDHRGWIAHTFVVFEFNASLCASEVGRFSRDSPRARGAVLTAERRIARVRTYPYLGERDRSGRAAGKVSWLRVNQIPDQTSGATATAVSTQLSQANLGAVAHATLVQYLNVQLYERNHQRGESDRAWISTVR